MVFFTLPKSQAIFQKFEGKSVENNWNRRVWPIAKSSTIFFLPVVESQRRCQAKFRHRA